MILVFWMSDIDTSLLQSQSGLNCRGECNVCFLEYTSRAHTCGPLDGQIAASTVHHIDLDLLSRCEVDGSRNDVLTPICLEFWHASTLTAVTRDGFIDN